MTARNNAEEMYTELFDRIIKNKYPPNTWLREDEIAGEFSMSRTPVRDVLRLLEKDGLIRIIPNRGAQVYAFTVDDLEDIYEIRRVLESLALEYAVPALSIHGLMDIRNRIEEAKNSEDYRLITEIDTQLHNYYIESSNRRRLIDMLNHLTRLMNTFRELGFQDEHVRLSTYEEHLQLIDAICIRDVAQAKRLCEEHIRNTKNRILGTVYRKGNSNGLL
jgi:DNA-binding GntR family transcriptional regulator